MRNRAESSWGFGRRVLLEASGGITLENVVEVARTGVDRISIGALTHSAPVLDLSMEFVGSAGSTERHEQQRADDVATGG